MRFLAIIAAAGLLAACDTRSGGYERNALSPNAMNEFGTFSDPATGCEYIVWNGYEKGGITPRLNADGQPLCIVKAAR